MNKYNFTTISVKPETFQEVERITKEMKISKHKVIAILIEIRKEYIKIRGRKEYMDFLKKENLQIDDFVKDIQHFKLLYNHLKGNYQLIPNDFFEKKYDIVPKENGS